MISSTSNPQSILVILNILQNAGQFRDSDHLRCSTMVAILFHSEFWHRQRLNQGRLYRGKGVPWGNRRGRRLGRAQPPLQERSIYIEMDDYEGSWACICGMHVLPVSMNTN